MAASTLTAMLAYAGPLGNAPTLTRELDATPSAATWILSSMSLGLAVSLLTAGGMGDVLGRRRLFVAGAWLFASGSVVCALAAGPVVFVLGRLVEGFGAAGIIATGIGLVSSETVTTRQHAIAASWWGASMGAGIALGPLLTGLLDFSGLWRLFYWLLTAASVAIAVAAARSFAESQRSPRRLDVSGAVLLSAGVTLVLVALVEARLGGAGVAAAYAVAAIVCLILFGLGQFRGRDPMLDVTLFRRPEFTAATLAAAAAGAGVIALMSFACTFLVTGMQMTTLGAGILLVLWSGTSAVVAVLVHRLPASFGGPWQLVAGLGATGAGMLLLTGLDTDSTALRLVPGLVAAGVGTGVLNAGLGRQAVATVPPEQAGIGTGTNNTARYVGASIGVTIVSLLAAGAGDTRAGLIHGWNQAAVLTASVSLVVALAVAALSRPWITTSGTGSTGDG